MIMLKKVTSDDDVIAALGVGEAWLFAVSLSLYLSLN